MAKRVSRRSEDELFIHKGWFRALSSAAAIIVSAAMLEFARNSDSQTGSGLAIMAVTFSIVWAVRNLRYAFDR